MKICYLGAGAWGFCLARLLAQKGYTIVSWTIEKELLEILKTTREHPYLKGRPAEGAISFTGDLEEALSGADMIVEAVTASGVRPVFEAVKKIGWKKGTPIVLTSKGIEQNSLLILSDVVISILGEEVRPSVGAISGPSFADEVSRGLPTAVVATSANPDTVATITDTFTTNFFRIYPCYDIRGAAFGGSLKNIIAIGCGISDGLALGCGAKAALMTRGLHEIVKLARAYDCRPETLYGLSGLGDLFLTCSSELSRNFRFGELLAEGYSPEKAKKEIGMVVEGAYSAVTAVQLARKKTSPMPISETVLAIIEGKIKPPDAVALLMARAIKEESL
jgi:glycerol-3-phosphate dehydrogenase (NAD(P)+)